MTVDEVTTIASDPTGTGAGVSKSVTIPSTGGWVFGLAWGYSGAFVSGDATDGGGSIGAPAVAYANPGNNDRLAIWAKYYSSPGTVTWTLTPATSRYHCWHLIRVSAKSNAKLQVTGGNHANSTAPADTTTLTPPTQATASCAIACMTHNSGAPTISAGTGYTLSAKQEDYGGAVQPGAGDYKVTSSNAAQTGSFSLTSSVEWSIATVLLSEPPTIWTQLGGSGNGYVDNAATDSITLAFTVPTGQAILLWCSLYAFDFDVTYITSISGFTRRAFQSWDSVGAVGSRDASVGICDKVLTGSATSVGLDFSSVSTDDPAAARYFRWGVIVVEQPDATNGFATATAVNNAQSNVTVVAPGSIAAPTDNNLTMMAFSNRGHASSLEPVTWGTDVNDSSLYYTGTENSAHQSGSMGAKQSAVRNTKSPTCTLNAQSVGARSCAMVYNLAGGSTGSSPATHFFALLGIGT